MDFLKKSLKSKDSVDKLKNEANGCVGDLSYRNGIITVVTVVFFLIIVYNLAISLTNDMSSQKTIKQDEAIFVVSGIHEIMITIKGDLPLKDTITQTYILLYPSIVKVTEVTNFSGVGGKTLNLNIYYLKK